MTGIIVTRLLINTISLSRIILINSNKVFTKTKKNIKLLKNNKIIKLFSLKRNIKKKYFQLNRCFLKNKSIFPSIAKQNRIFYNLNLKNNFNSIKNFNDNVLPIIHKNNIKKKSIYPYKLYLKNKIFKEEKKLFTHINKDIPAKKNRFLSDKNLLQGSKAQKSNDASSLSIFSLKQQSLKIQNGLVKKIKSEVNYLSPVSFNLEGLIKKNKRNNAFAQTLKEKALVVLRQKNKNCFNPYMLRIPKTFPSQTQYHASKLIQNILDLKTTINQNHVVASHVNRAQEDKPSDLIKLDKRLTHIQEIIEKFIQIKQNEMNNLTFNLFNENRKKTYSDFL